jgi:hypothetical protein
MMSESLIDRVDMTKFYDIMGTPALFSCCISFEDSSSNTNIAGFKRNDSNIEISILCSQDIVSRLISNDPICAIEILYDNDEILKIEKDDLSMFAVDITYLQDAMCKVKIVITLDSDCSF